MELSVNLSHFKRTREGEEKRTFAHALQICRDAGFRIACCPDLPETHTPWDSI